MSAFRAFYYNQNKVYMKVELTYEEILCGIRNYFTL